MRLQTARFNLSYDSINASRLQEKCRAFTSPHLVSFTERIKVNNVEITEAEVVELAGEVKRIINRLSAETLEPRTPDPLEPNIL